MKKNMGSADRTIRLLVAIAVVVLYTTHVVAGVVSMVLLALAGIFLLTSFIGVCPLYLPFGINTSGKKK